MSEGIVYQNKDIEFKLLSESFREKSFEAYGLKLPRIKELLPTNLPSVSANELRMDNMFLLEDGTLAIVDYESDNKAHNHIKYINYIGRVLEQWYKEHKSIPNIRMIVIYTGDIEKAESEFRMECMTLQMEQVFVRNLPAEEIYRTVRKKLEQTERLTEKELMQLIILPLAEKGMENKQRRIIQVIDIADKIKNEQDQKLVLSGLLVISDKFIDSENMGKIRRRFEMTQIGRFYEEEKLKAVKEERWKIAEKLLMRGDDIKTVKDITGLTEIEIMRLDQKRKEIELA